MTRPDLEEEIAAGFGATPDLLPHLPELLADLWALGGHPEVVVDLLRPLGLPPGSTRVLDLGCGKGGVAVPLARSLGFRVVGVDGFAPFLVEARARAARHKVAALCEFRLADIRDVVTTTSGFDVVLHAAHGPLLDGEPAPCPASGAASARGVIW